MKRMKQILVGLLATMMLATGLMITPMEADAAGETIVKETIDHVETGVIFVSNEDQYDFKTLWATKTAPTRDGYVFGGWYAKEDNESFTPIKESEGSQYTEAYAKFVPAEVLSVRAQLQATTEETNGDVASTYLRLLSGVNGLDYQKVGFEILYNKNYKDPNEENNQKANNITKVYKTITNTETDDTSTDEKESIAASSVFGVAATHFSVLRLDGIFAANFEKVIYVKPHWTTLDGTTVYGQAKYVRVMDGYANNHYISVPVNFLTGSQVAAGQLEMTYDDSLEVVGYEAGVLMPAMEFNSSTAGVVKMVGNAPTKGTNAEPKSDIYANVWFKVKSDAKGNLVSYEFTINEIGFCDWEANSLVEDVTAWDVTYYK